MKYTFQAALNEAKSSLKIEDFSKKFEKYEFFSELKDYKKGPNSVQFEVSGKKGKVTLQFGELEVTVGNKTIKTINVDQGIGQDEVDAVVDALKKV